MASVEDLKAAILENLTSRGLTNALKGQLHKEIYDVLHQDDLPRPRAPPDALLIEDLIREYLSFTGYRHALAAFNAETGFDSNNTRPQTGTSSTSIGGTSTGKTSTERVTGLSRRFLAEELDVLESPASASVPLLYSVVCNAKASRSARLEEITPTSTVIHRIPGHTTAARRVTDAHEESYGEDTFDSESSVPGGWPTTHTTTAFNRPYSDSAVTQTAPMAKQVSSGRVGITSSLPIRSEEAAADQDIDLRWKDGVFTHKISGNNNQFSLTRQTGKPSSSFSAPSARPSTSVFNATVSEPIVMFGAAKKT